MALEIPIAKTPRTAERVHALVHQRIQFQMQVIAALYRIDDQQRRLQCAAAGADKVVLVAEILARRRSVLVQQAMAPYRGIVMMPRAQLLHYRDVELAIAQAPANAFEVDPLQIVAVEKSQHFSVGAALRHMFPRTCVELRWRQDHAQLLRIGKRR